jgi:hypothetical protein
LELEFLTRGGATVRLVPETGAIEGTGKHANR